jgi:ADP-glucose pyrophosphorylase
MKIKGVRKWYYYNMIEDEEAFREHRMKQAKISLGLQKMAEKMRDIMDMSSDEKKRKIREFREKLKLKYAKSLG